MATLALRWYEDGEQACDPVVVQGTCAMAQKFVQNAGKAFWDRFELPLCEGKVRKKGQNRGEDKESLQSPASDKGKDRKAKREEQKASKDGGLLKMSEELQGKDLYELLEVEASASSEDIKKSYRKLVLLHHPDKIQDPTEEQRQHFLLVQEAFEILSDTQKRRRYESTLDFDDTVPTDFRKSDDFFEVFRPVFKKNARWSEKTGVPDLGDAATPIEQVKAFYEFWLEFESWRDPLAMVDVEELYCLEEAECREERRWMERENAKVARKFKQMEKDRILDFVKLAEKHDPRVVSHRETQRLAREEEKAKKAAEKEAEKRRIEEERRAKEELLEAARQAEEAKRQAERKAKEEQKQILKNARQRLRGLHKKAPPAVQRAVHAEQLQEVCLQLRVEELNSVADQLELLLSKDLEQSEVIDLLHAQIKQYGGTPIEDTSVKLHADGDTASTGSPASDNAVESDDDEDAQASQKKSKAKAPLRQETEAERLRREEEAERKRAAELKKKEQQKKLEEQRLAAAKKDEAKERKAQEREKQKQEKKAEEEQRKREELKQKKTQQAEEQRLQQLAQEEEKQRLAKEATKAEVFTADRVARLDLCEGTEEKLLATDLDGAIQTAMFGTPECLSNAAQAIKIIAQQLPSAEPVRLPKAPDSALQGKKKAAAEKTYAEEKATAEASEQSRREAEDYVIDLAVACLVHQGAEEDAKTMSGKLAQLLVLGMRPPVNSPEVPKEVKTRIKKQRLRLRAAVLKLLRQFESSSDKPSSQGSSASWDAIKEGTALVVIEEGPIFASPSSYDTIGQATIDMKLVAAGRPVDAEGYSMVPLRPSGTVEMRIVKVVPGEKGGKKKAPQSGAAAVSLPARFQELARLAAAGSADVAEAALEVAFYQGFDPDVTSCAPVTAVQMAVEEPAQPAQPEPAVASKQSKKGKGQDKISQEEDLDAILSELGVEVGATSSNAKKNKKGKK
mmetsp:Transcript_10803/g.24436  ORF Transcript_10803/g.24436 Transcript_10803/m.24436 type:complete len:963 (+) Transcript_10803:104-2992(+)